MINYYLYDIQPYVAMREYAKKTKNPSRTLESNPKASRQAPIDVILQQYTDRNIQRYAEDEGSIQGKFNTVQREETDKNELLQGKFKSVPAGEQKTVQREKKPNNTGLPDNLKSGIENLSGYSMDDVRVHYNSSKPAQLQALAYAQGSDIHITPGQEQYLPHEAWHVVQQKQGRVQPTTQLQGVNLNDNEGLEKEADMIGGKVIQRVSRTFAKGVYDYLDKSKWREFIDKKDHGAAIEKYNLKLISHPGEYYNFHWNGNEKTFLSDAFNNFIQADKFVSSRIGKRITTKEYLHMHDLALQVDGMRQGLRSSEVTWGLPLSATRKQLDEIQKKGLRISKERNRYTVTVPEPQGKITSILDEIFNDFYANQEKETNQKERFHNIIKLYQKLESLHAFNDGTSRTNHLLLNKLLCEHGLRPTILTEPNSPMFSTEEFGQVVFNGMMEHQDVDLEEDKMLPRFKELLPKPESDTDRKVRLKMKEFGFEEKKKQISFEPPLDDSNVDFEPIYYSSI